MGKHRKKRTDSKFIEKVNKQRLIDRKDSLPSKGEARIIKFLEKRKIRYTREWTCKSLKVGGYSLFMDFYLRDYKTFIEYDGIQHYQPVYGKVRLKKQKYFDEFKDKWCSRNGKRMIRIKYSDYSRIGTTLYKELHPYISK